MSDLERIAKAVVDELSRLKWDDLPEEGQKLYLDMTKAVLQALAEPSDEVIESVRRELYPKMPSENHRTMMRKRIRFELNLVVEHILDQEQGHE